MIWGVGVDLLEINHFKKILTLNKESFLNYAFTTREINYLNNKRGLEHLATTFTAKEACFKALSESSSQLCLKEIEILRDKTGKPEIHLLGKLARQFPAKKFHFFLSSTFDFHFALSLVVVEQF